MDILNRLVSLYLDFAELQALEEKGYIKTENGKARTITLVGDENDSK